MGLTNMTSYNLEFKPHYGLKWRIPLPRDEAPKKTDFTQDYSVNLLRALKIRSTVFTREVLVHDMELWFIMLWLQAVKRLPCGFLDESDHDWDHSCSKKPEHNDGSNPSDKTWNTPLSALNAVKVAAKTKVFRLVQYLS